MSKQHRINNKCKFCGSEIDIILSTDVEGVFQYKYKCNKCNNSSYFTIFGYGVVVSLFSIDEKIKFYDKNIKKFRYFDYDIYGNIIEIISTSNPYIKSKRKWWIK